jgi:hypothetical protein
MGVNISDISVDVRLMTYEEICETMDIFNGHSNFKSYDHNVELTYNFKVMVRPQTNNPEAGIRSYQQKVAFHT